ncbi:hypothetical protein BAFK78_H023 (plasmid) [Borreliella afzelii K78]|nr:hypothetical protein BAFK78_H023 [Borreliella afzelii K78]
MWLTFEYGGVRKESSGDRTTFFDTNKKRYTKMRKKEKENNFIVASLYSLTK